MKKEIAILIDSLKSGGAQKQSALLARALAEDYHVTFIVFESDGVKQEFQNYISGNRNIDVKFLTGNKFNIILKTFQLLRKVKPEIILSYLPFGNLINGLVGKLIGTKFRVGGIRNAYTDEFKNRAQKYIHNQLLTASISNSILGKKSHFDAGYTKKPIYHIPNCYIIEHNSYLRPEKNEITIISVGRFVLQKNYPLALSSFKKALENIATSSPYLKIKYQIVGYGFLEQEIRGLIGEMELGSQVEIILNPPNINKYYQEADLYLCTSKFEGLSNSIMEAMAFSLPIIATDVGGNAELVREEKNGHLVAQELNSVSDRLTEMIENPSKREIFGQESFKIIKNEFSEDVFKSNYLNLISELTRI